MGGVGYRKTRTDGPHYVFDHHAICSWLVGIHTAIYTWYRSKGPGQTTQALWVVGVRWVFERNAAINLSAFFIPNLSRRFPCSRCRPFLCRVLSGGYVLCRALLSHPERLGIFTLTSITLTLIFFVVGFFCGVLCVLLSGCIRSLVTVNRTLRG